MLLTPSPQAPLFNFSPFPRKPYLYHRISPRIRNFPLTASFKSQFNYFQPLTNAAAIKNPEKQQNPASSCCNGQNPALSRDSDEKSNIANRVAKSMSATLFCIAIGFFPLGHGRIQLPAIAAVATKVEIKEKEVVLKQKDHEYSNNTRELLRTVSILIRSIEEVRLGNGDMKAVESALREVKSKKRELQDEIMNGLYAELRELKSEKEKLVKTSEELLESVLKAKREQESLAKKVGGEKDGEEVKKRVAELEEEMSIGEEKYNDMWERIGEIEDQIMRRETMALSIGVRELLFIERECELLVEKFGQEIRRKSKDR